jgi:methyl-accepting chemotaxis protein
MFRNVKMIWKLMLLAIMTPLAVTILIAFTIVQVGKLKYEYDNLYGFMLIPIMAIDQGALSQEQLLMDVKDLAQSDLTQAERAQIQASIRQDDDAVMAVITQYENEWLTTLSPEFTQQLADMGQQGLQADEADALSQFKSAHDAFVPQRDAILSGNEGDPRIINDSLSQMDSSMRALVKVNKSFADLSNESAQQALTRTRFLSIGVGAALSLVVLGLSLVLTRSINRPLSYLMRACESLAIGDLNSIINLGVNSSIANRKDEIGELGKGLSGAEAYLQEITDIANRIADGDLTVKVSPKSDKDDLGRAFQRMVAGLRELVTQVSGSVLSLNSSSMQLATAADQAGQATRQIAATIQQVARGTTEQNESVTRTAASVEQMSRAIDGVARGAQEQAGEVGRAANVASRITDAIHQVSANAQAGTTASTQAAQVAQGGADKVAATVKGMSSLKAKVGLSAQKVKEMGQRSDQIGAIVETIDDIASQTNLLALNAAIEAARAGEHGKGFAVVADEVRKLAERSSSATKEIGTLIDEIQKTVAEAVSAMDEGTREMDSSVIQANQAGAALSDILNAVKTVNGQVEGIAVAAQQMNGLSNDLVGAMDAVSAVVEENTAATEEMAAGSAEVTQAIERIARVSEENSAAIEEVSGSTEEMSAQVEEVTGSAQNLAEMARGLQGLVRRFKLEEQAAEPAAELEPVAEAVPAKDVETIAEVNPEAEVGPGVNAGGQ